MSAGPCLLRGQHRAPPCCAALPPALLRFWPATVLPLVRRHAGMLLRCIQRCPCCRRWWALARSPVLLRQLTIRLEQPRIVSLQRAPVLPRLRSLAGWMAQAARHVSVQAARHVSALELTVGGTDSHPEEAEAEALVAAILAVCGAAGSLRSLTLCAQLWDDYCRETAYDRDNMSMAGCCAWAACAACGWWAARATTTATASA